ncbi:MAG: transposase [Patescibacteria group bacterium]
MREISFETGGFYHVYNRGTDKRNIFADKSDYSRFLKSMDVFNAKKPIGSIYEHVFDLKLGRFGRLASKSKLVDIVCYCLNLNHYHMLVEQKVDGGVSEFIKRLSGGYTKYFNHKYKRSGVLFQGKFKALFVDSNEYLLHLSAYINLNNKAHRVQGSLFRSSWDEYLNFDRQSLCTKDVILKQFKNSNEYKDFAESSFRDILERKDSMRDFLSLLFE